MPPRIAAASAFLFNLFMSTVTSFASFTTRLTIAELGLGKTAEPVSSNVRRLADTFGMKNWRLSDTQAKDCARHDAIAFKARHGMLRVSVVQAATLAEIPERLWPIHARYNCHCSFISFLNQTPNNSLNSDSAKAPSRLAQMLGLANSRADKLLIDVFQGRADEHFSIRAVQMSIDNVRAAASAWANVSNSASGRKYSLRRLHFIHSFIACVVAHIYSLRHQRGLIIIEPDACAAGAF